MRLSVLLIAACMAFGLACNRNTPGNSKQVRILTSKTWTYDVEAIEKASEELGISAGNFKTMKGAMSRLDGAVFRFNTDSTMVLDIPRLERTFEGTWKLSPDGKEFYMIIPGTSNLPNPVEEISENKIVFGIDNSKGIVFPKIFKPVR